jgi:GPH family glycoside/pentoside/hexuronide:cation symporter
MMTIPTDERLPVRTKIMYGAGDIGFSLTDTTIAVLFTIFLIDVAGLDPGRVAVALFIGRSWDYINDPMVGFISDRMRTRWGRRRPFLLFGFIPFAITFSLMWWIPPGLSKEWLVVYFASIYLIFEACATLVYMPYYTLTPELTLDYDERTSLTSYRMAFSIIGGLLAFTVPLEVIGSTIPQNADRVFQVGVAFAILSALPLLITFLGTRERKEYQNQPQPGLRDSFRAAVKNRPFIFAAGIFLFTWSALEFVQGILLFFLKYRMRMEEYSQYIAGAVFISALLTLPLWVWASNRWDKRKAYIIGMVFLSGVIIILTVISPSWGMIIIMTLAILAGIGVGAVHVLPWAMIPDAVEWDELSTGQRHEGMFYSLVTLLRKIASSIVVPMIPLTLKWSGYVSNAPVQKESAVNAIRALTGPIPSVLLCVGILFALLYPLGRDRHAQVRAELAARSVTGTTIPDR